MSTMPLISEMMPSEDMPALRIETPVLTKIRELIEIYRDAKYDKALRYVLTGDVKDRIAGIRAEVACETFKRCLAIIEGKDED